MKLLRTVEAIAIAGLATQVAVQAEQANRQELQEQVSAWLHAGDRFEFAGTVEFVKTMRLVPNPSRLEELGAYDEEETRAEAAYARQVAALDGDPQAEAVLDGLREAHDKHLRRLAHRRDFFSSCASTGVTIAQVWRVDVAEGGKMRVELACRDREPPDPTYEP